MFLPSLLALCGQSAHSAAPAAASAPATEWTILFYGAGDNSSEETLLPDLAAARRALRKVSGLEFIALVDRSPKYSDDSRSLGEDFDDTRLYRLTAGAAERLPGDGELEGIGPEAERELDLGDADTLRAFIDYGKRHYPARHTALFVYSHGSGSSMAPDESSRASRMYPAELSAELRESEQVELLVLDACSMGSLENAYEWRAEPGRFGARWMFSSASVSAPLPYERFFARFAPGKHELAQTDARAFGLALLEEYRAHRAAWVREGGWSADMGMECYALLDLAKVAAAKQALDAFARSLRDADLAALEALRGSGEARACLDYFVPGEDSWPSMPYFDAHALARRAAECAELSAGSRELAASWALRVDECVEASAATQPAAGFAEGTSGLGLLFPDGDAPRKLFEGRQWQQFGWYTPLPGSTGPESGRLAFCADGAQAGNGRVENWFERLDAWYDDTSADPAGKNGYAP